MTRAFLTLVCVLSAAPALAQDCTPTFVESLQWGPPGAEGRIIWSQPVPPGRILVLDNAGLATFDGRPLEWMLQRLVNGHYHPLARNVGSAAGTPVLAWTGRQVMLEGPRVGGRVNAPDDFGNGSPYGMALLFTGFSYPAACLSRVLGVEPSNPSMR